MSFMQKCCRAAIMSLMISSISTSIFAADLSVVPGKSIGRTYLGESRTEVLQSLGQPSETMPSKNGTVTSISGLREDRWIGKVNYTPILSVCYKAGRVVQISTSSSSFKTLDGISVFSTLREIRRHFSHLHRYTYPDPADPDRLHTRFYDPVTGIAFVFTGVTPKATYPSDFDFLTVYRPGHKVVMDY
jgi:hypothetical protein